MATFIATNRKNKVLGKILSFLGFYVTDVSVEKGDIPYLEVSAYGNPNKNEPKCS